MEHDNAYKQIFSHPETVTELLQGFVREEWVKQIDFSTLEKVNGSYVSDELKRREDDLIWRVKVRESWIYVYLLIEFQSRNDPWMALRIMVYTGLLYQDLIKTKKVVRNSKLPPVFPIVLYNGEKPWSAKRNLAELIEPLPGGLQAYRPSQRYFLLDEGRVKKEELAQAEGTLAEIIRLESGLSPEALSEVVHRLTLKLKEPRYDSLRRALAVWINRNILTKIAPPEHRPHISELQEIDNMLAERVETWVENWKQQGLQEGWQQGMQQGMQQGKTEVLLRLLEQRFGALPRWAKEKVVGANDSELELWVDAIFKANSLEKLLSLPSKE